MVKFKDIIYHLFNTSFYKIIQSICIFEQQLNMNMNSFLETVLTVLLVYYGLKILFKFLKPYLLKYMVKKATKGFGNAFGENPFQPEKARKNEEGKITIDPLKSSTKTSKSKVGEYIDFEELD